MSGRTRTRAGGTCARSLILVLAILLLALCTGSCPAASSWQIRTLPAGSGWWVEAVSPSSFYFLGDFEGSREWGSADGGFSGSIRNPGPPFPADSVASFSAAFDRQGVVTLDGRLWFGRRDGRDWENLSIPDTLGTASAVLCRQGGGFWVGTRSGTLLGTNPAAEPGVWSTSLELGQAAVERILPSGDDRVCALLDDGSLLAQSGGASPLRRAGETMRADSSWIAAPFSAFLFDISRSGSGWAIERGSLTLWGTADGGLGWEPLSTSLAAPEMARWAEHGRRLRMKAGGLGVLACGDALLATHDGGETWQIASCGIGMFRDAVLDDFNDVVTIGEAIHRSSDHANSFVQIMGTDFSRIAMGSITTHWALDRGLLLSVQQGDRWLRQPLPGPADELRRISARGDYDVWLHFEATDGSRTFHSGDRGATYQRVDAAGSLRGLTDWSFLDAGGGWACADSAILRSTNDGAEWVTVRTEPSRIGCMAVRDSSTAVFATGFGFLFTRDGGRSWSRWTSPAAGAARSVSFAGEDRFVVAGDGVGLIATSPEWQILAWNPSTPPLRSVVMAGDSGWAVGDDGVILGTSDGGASWAPYRVSLELNSLNADLQSLSAIDADHAATGSARTLLRLLPDGSGPTFRYGISTNPYLPRYLDIHVTARERLLGDTLGVSIDGVPVPTALLDEEGFLYRSRYKIPEGSSGGTMTTRGRDWLGNERTDVRILWTLSLDRLGRGTAVWAGEELEVEGEPMGTVGMIERTWDLQGEIDDPRWRASGSPFQIAAGGDLIVTPGAPGLSLAVWQGDAESEGPPDHAAQGGSAGRWRILPSGPCAMACGSILLVIRDLLPAPAEDGAPNALSVYPVPARGDFTIAWERPAGLSTRWDLIDLTGRHLAGGSIPAPSGGALRVSACDGEGRPLPSGIYWVRAECGPLRAVRRLVIVR